jgi:heat shock protein HtpX
MPNTIKTALLLGLLSAFVIFLGGAFGGQGGLLIAFVFAVAMNVGSYWFSDKLVLRMYHAQEVPAGHPLYQVTARLAQKAGLPMPRVYVIPQASPNAFATGRNPEHAAVAATEGILRLLPEDELEAVIAHELSHVRHRDILISSVAGTLAAVIMFMASMARWAMIFGGFGGGGTRDDRGANPLALLAMAILAPIAALMIQMAISRQREFAADRGGAELLGSPVALASALRRIDAAARRVPLQASPATAHLLIMNPFSRRGFGSLFLTHPPTEERIKALMGNR